MDVLVDVDVGDRRTRVFCPGNRPWSRPALVAGAKSLRLVGLQAYSGSASHTVGFEPTRQGVAGSHGQRRSRPAT